ncbi:hypothetical protein [Dactylosporangium sp. CA-233914]|uniref:hypothetical protein n=1 Tax=Dactylosporangium sp. CA-233914 TaxID=3239934 RepID=UPI003D9073B8
MVDPASKAWDEIRGRAHAGLLPWFARTCAPLRPEDREKALIPATASTTPPTSPRGKTRNNRSGAPMGRACGGERGGAGYSVR